MARVVLAVWMVLGSGWVAAAEEPVIVTEKSDGTTVHVKIGQPLELRLTNTIEGAGWEQMQLKGDAVKDLNPRRMNPCDEFTPKDPANKDSTVGVYILRFTGARKGATKLTARQMIPGGPTPVSTKATKMITEIAVTIVVAADDAKPVTVTEKSDGQTVSLKVGQTIELRLTNDREGAGWEGFEVSGDALAAHKPKQYGRCDDFEAADKTKETSSLGVYVARYVGAKAGQAKLIARHIHPSGPKPMARLATQKIAEITITVNVE